MFVTGPAGAAKITAIEAALYFCVEFCKSLNIISEDKTFLLTATTGCTSALFG